MEIKIKVKGVVEDDHQDYCRRPVKDYPEGSGLYAIMNGDVLVGVRIVGSEIKRDDNGKETVDVDQQFFIPRLSVAVGIEKGVEKVRDNIESKIGSIQGSIDEVLDALESIKDEIGEQKNNSGSVSEKTLLSAIEIVSRTNKEK